mmetsp:Transcript_10304/g.24725  ORF Transcript_10304/g.24725 Transcript_10304/m.24725 type:complete len:105 (-) Transcript_10304:253-567(-)
MQMVRKHTVLHQHLSESSHRSPRLLLSQSQLLLLPVATVPVKKLDPASIRPILEKLFYTHNMIAQWIQDVYGVPIPRSTISETIITTTKEPDVDAAVVVPPRVL